MNTDYEKALKICLNFIKFRPRSTGEVRQKLLSKGITIAVINDVLPFLQENHWLDDELFCREWIQSRLTSKVYGPFRVRQELLQKNLDKDLIESELSQAYAALPMEVWACSCLKNKYRSRLEELPELDPEKLKEQLVRLGYSYRDAQRALEIFPEWIKNEESEQWK